MTTEPKLTIGMAAFEDPIGLWETLQGLRINHGLLGDLRHVELLVVDQTPQAAGHAFMKDMIEQQLQAHTAGVRYIEMPDPIGTSPPRNRVFAEARAPWVMCIDAHIFVLPLAIRKFLDWIDRHKRSNDLLSGPIMHDTLTSFYTHFNDFWSGEMWGQWGQAWEMPDGARYSVVEGEGGQARFITLGMNPQTVTDPALPTLDYTGHQRQLLDAGHVLLGLHDADEFEIPGMGLGLFACRKDAWLGFNENSRGFGGEEMYIHEKFRRAGHRAICLGHLKWLHRFLRPKHPGYPITRRNKVRNYLIELNELGIEADRCHAHFVGGGLFPQQEWEAIAADPIHAQFDIRRKPIEAPDEGPGTELQRILKGIGIEERPEPGEAECRTCRALMSEMNRQGVAGCRDPKFRKAFLTAIRPRMKKWGWDEKLAAGIKAAWNGLPLSIDGMYDEAVNRAAARLEATQTAAPDSPAPAVADRSQPA